MVLELNNRMARRANKSGTWTKTSTSIPSRCQFRRNSRFITGMIMALPFVICFSLFGICNLVAGTIVTVLACRPRFTIYLDDEFLQEYPNQSINNLLDPLKIVGPILLITGATLIIIGIMLGVIACRSVYEKKNLAKITNSSAFKPPNATESVIEMSPISTAQSPANINKIDLSLSQIITDEENCPTNILLTNDSCAITSFIMNPKPIPGIPQFNEDSSINSLESCEKIPYGFGNMNTHCNLISNDSNHQEKVNDNRKNNFDLFYKDIECIVSRNEFL